MSLTATTLNRLAGAHYRAAGAGKGVVCLHASASSSAQWRPLMDRLAALPHTRRRPVRIGPEPGVVG